MRGRPCLAPRGRSGGRCRFLLDQPVEKVMRVLGGYCRPRASGGWPFLAMGHWQMMWHPRHGLIGADASGPFSAEGATTTQSLGHMIFAAFRSRYHGLGREHLV